MFPATAESVQRVMDRIRKNKERMLWGIENGESVLAIVEYYIREDEVIYIAGIAVSEQCRGQGIGRFMINTLQSKYNMAIELETDDDAIGFYRKCGFETSPFDKNNIRRYKCVLPVIKTNPRTSPPSSANDPLPQ